MKIDKKKNIKTDRKKDFQVNVDGGRWEMLALLKARTKKSFKRLVDDALVNTYSLEDIIQNDKL